jgi:hypothetical protein
MSATQYVLAGWVGVRGVGMVGGTSEVIAM